MTRSALFMKGTRTFADEQPVRLAVAHAGYGLLATLAQHAPLAAANALLQGVPIQLGQIAGGLEAAYKADIAAAIKKAGKLLAHFHACGSDRGTPGNDHIDWKPIIRALKSIGYKGDVVIESFTTDVKVIARAAACSNSVAAWRIDSSEVRPSLIA